jgi:hypothetical protein
MDDSGAVERLARALHEANAAELAARGIETVEFPFEGDREVQVVVAWESLDASARRWFEGMARHLAPEEVEGGLLVRLPE